jgi:hypothetical protein
MFWGSLPVVSNHVFGLAHSGGALRDALSDP